MRELQTAVERFAAGSPDPARQEHSYGEALGQLSSAQQRLAQETNIVVPLAQGSTALAALLGLGVLGFAVQPFRAARAAQDVEAQRQARQAVEERFAHLSAGSSELVALLSREGIIEYAGGGVEQVLGRDANQCIGQSFVSLLHPDEVGLGLQLLNSLVMSPGAVRTEHLRLAHPRAGWRTLEVALRNELETAGLHGMVLNARDVTEQIQAQERFRREAFYDPLTGLPNRALFMEQLQQAVQRARRDPSYQFAVLFLDLDRFKLVNDSFGYSAGDELLKAFAARLQLCLGLSAGVIKQEANAAAALSTHALARWGGDEFCILVDGLPQPSGAIRLAEHILLRLHDSFVLGLADVFASASIGVATCASQYQSAEAMIRDADLAMYRAKTAGRARFQLYDEAMHEQALHQLRLETDLRRALDRRQFEVVFQPIVMLEGGHLEGVEALVRWRHPQRGLLSPGEFIQVAETTGLIVPLGRWMLEESCRQFKSLQQEPGAPRMLSVNFSAQEFAQRDLVQQVEQALRAFELPGSSLHLEITESAMMGNVEQVSAMLRALKALGVRISIDDFGTGYSCLSYLQSLPIDTLKIDRSFVLGMQRQQEGRAIVHTIVTLARNLGLQTIAEGAETAEQVRQLQEMRCHYGQGFFFSKPVEVEVLRRQLRSWASPVGREPVRHDQRLMRNELVVASLAQREASRRRTGPAERSRPVLLASSDQPRR
ncbi:MAG TPA: EAL domain-containing protein [Terriglobales bacterium]